MFSSNFNNFQESCSRYQLLDLNGDLIQEGWV